MTGHDLPFDGRPFRLRMGVRPLHLAEWLDPDERAPAELALKAELVGSRRDDVVAVIDDPAVDAAAAELWDLVRAAAPDSSRAPAGEHPVVRCGLSTQEDWCLLVPLGKGLVFAAACVCFPTRWVLREKLGSDTAAVHAPVPGYREQLAGPVDRFLDRLTAERPVWRRNWNLMDDPALFQPRTPEPPPIIAAAEAGDRIWLREERQTLRRLPSSGAIAFSIRVRQRPLSELAALPGALQALRQAVAAMPPATRGSKGIDSFLPAMEAWIASRPSVVEGQAQMG